MRRDLLDEVVWKEIARLLEDRHLIEDELERRLNAARNADPTQRREETLRRDLRAPGKASSVSSRPIMRAFSHLTSCAVACPIRAAANRLACWSASDRTPIEGAGSLSASRRIRDELPRPPALVRRRARYNPTPTRAAPSREESPRRQRQDRHPPLHPPPTHPSGRKGARRHR